MGTIQLNIEGMHCDGCVKSITKALQAIPGVNAIDVSLEQKRAIVTHDPAQAGLPQLKAAVEDAGFDVV